MIHRGMRRSEREITDEGEIDGILSRAAVCRVAMCRDGEPYLVPLCFGRDGDRLYFHCAREGLKLDILRENPRVCFEVEDGVEVVDTGRPCDWRMTYRSVIGFGQATIVEDPSEKRYALNVLVGHYSAGPYEFPDDEIERTGIIRIDIERMTGKRWG